MPTAMTCPKCNKQLAVTTEHAGKRVRCPSCQAVVAIPADRKQNVDEKELEELDAFFDREAAPAAATRETPQASVAMTPAPRIAQAKVSAVQVVSIKLKFWNAVWLVLLFWFATAAAFIILLMIVVAFLLAAGVTLAGVEQAFGISSAGQ